MSYSIILIGYHHFQKLWYGTDDFNPFQRFGVKLVLKKEAFNTYIMKSVLVKK